MEVVAEEEWKVTEKTGQKIGLNPTKKRKLKWKRL